MAKEVFPPRIPSELHELRRAVELLGMFYKQGDLDPRRTNELVGLIHEKPESKTRAKLYKLSLRALAREVSREPDPEAE